MAEPNGYIQGSNGVPLELVDSKARQELPKKLTRPATAQVGDYLRIKAIGADGTMEVEAVPAPTGGNVDLTGYATEVWVQELLAAFPTFEIEVVQELPAAGAEKTIYLVPFADDSGSYLEYLYINGAWEVLGTGRDTGAEAKIPTAADLSGTTATFRNSAGVALFTLDLSGLGGGPAAVYGNLVLSAEELTIGEGQSGTFTVALDKAPSANQPVYLAVSDGSRLSVTPATLTFTPENWETPQAVTVTSLEDDDEEDNAVTVTLTSTAVDARQVAVAIRDNDGEMEIVTDGLVLNMDYTGHVGDESDTITDPVSGMTFKNFSYFTKEETGITGPKKYKYLMAVVDDAKTAFTDTVKATGGFTVEAFGTRAVPCFFLPNYKSVIDTGNADGWPSTRTIVASASFNVPRILQDESSDRTVSGFGTYTINGMSYPMNNSNIGDLFPHIAEFKHIVITCTADGHADCYVNGVKGDAPVAVENFKTWDFDTMFGGDWSLISDLNTAGVTTTQRIYNRVLTAEEVQQNMAADAKKLGLTTF